MILINGKVLDSKETNNVLSKMEMEINHTLNQPALDPIVVVEACSKLSEKIFLGTYDNILDVLKNERKITSEQIEIVVHLLKKESLLYKLKMELGSNILQSSRDKPLYSDKIINKKLFHL